MNKLEFTTEISRLKYFFNFKLDDENKIKEWHNKLSRYSAKAFKLSIDHIINTSKSAPAFSEILSIVQSYHAKEPRKRDIQPKDITQGLAPLTDTKLGFVKEMMTMLAGLFDIKDRNLRKIRAEEIKGLWSSTFPNLPEYRTIGQCRELARLKDIDELERLGF